MINFALSSHASANGQVLYFGGAKPVNGTSTSECITSSPAEEERDAAQEVEAGSRTEYKRVDEVFVPEKGNWFLRDSGPVNPKSKEDKYREFCFTIVRRLDPRTFVPESTLIEIKSQYLKKACAGIIKQYRGISWTASVVRIEPQTFLAFSPLLQAHVEALSAKADLSIPEQTTVAHLKLLLDYIRAEHSATLDEIAALLAHGEITFDLMWCILTPGTIFYTTCEVSGEPRAVRLKSSEKHAPDHCPPFWRLECEYVDATGARSPGAEAFGFSDYSVSIAFFHGVAKIASLKAYPMCWHPRDEDVRVRLIARGKRWQALDGVHHRYYNSVAYQNRDCGYVKININSRVMIDIASFRLVKPNYRLPTVKGADENKVNYDDGNKSVQHLAMGREMVARKKEENLDRPALFTTPTDEQLLLTPAIVYGFSLGDKLWLEFNVDHVKTFTWNDEAFERLVLPPRQKNLVMDLVESHKANSLKFDDFIEGKGKGLVITLHGPPGVGKTLSAEASSEHVRRPLYVVGAGDLGTDAAQLNTVLSQIFQVATAWRAIVLVDEADVFLEQRSMHDIQRNALVAVFLRQLEYYQGILFLTTNRVRSFDEAFQSRIHVALHYRDLDAGARLAIWRAFLEKVGVAPGDMSPAEEGLLAARELNGRQIKNAVRTAGAVASNRGERVSLAHIGEVIDVMEQFEQDFRELASHA